MDPADLAPEGFDPVSEISRKDHSHPAAYCLVHLQSGRIYPGSTGDLYVRVNQHRTMLSNSAHKNRNLQEVYDQDPRFGVLFVGTETREQAQTIEQHMLDTFKDSGKLLNLSPDAKTNRGVVMTDDVRDRIREANHRQFSSEESRQRHSEIIKAKWQDPEYRAKQQGRVFSEERLGAMSAATKKKWDDPVHREKMLNLPPRTTNPVSVKGTVYPNTKHAARVLGIPPRTLDYRLRSDSDKFTDYQFVEEGT